eukprot:gene4749-4923_t
MAMQGVSVNTRDSSIDQDDAYRTVRGIVGAPTLDAK